MYPDALCALLDEQLVKVLLTLVADIQEYKRIAYRLLYPLTPYIRRTSRQVITRRRTPTALFTCGDLYAELMMIGSSFPAAE